MLKTMVVWGLCAVGIASMPAQAAGLEAEGARLHVTGTLDGESAAAFAEQLAGGQVRTVVFEDSTGGSYEVAEGYAQAIRRAGASTEVRGMCHDACAYAFLAGKEHRFGRGLHVNSLLVPLRTRTTAADIERTLVEFRAPPAVPAAGSVPAPAREPWLPAQGLLFTATPTLFGRIYNSYWCDGTQGRDPSKCALLSDADPYKLGVLTP